MSEFLRLVLLLALAGCAVTIAIVATAWWMEETRRLSRMIGRCLGGPADAVIIAHGHNAAVAVSVEADQVLTLKKGGAQALLYPLHGLMGAELVVDNQVAARVYKSEPRKALDAINTDARSVRLRLIFDNIKNPDFELELYGAGDETRDPASAIHEARTWIARADAIMRRPVQVRPPPVTEYDDEEGDDEAPF